MMLQQYVWVEKITIPCPWHQLSTLQRAAAAAAAQPPCGGGGGGGGGGGEFKAS